MENSTKQQTGSDEGSNSTGNLFPDDKVRLIGAYLKDPSNPLKGRFRALFALNALATPLAVELICDCFADTSVLLRHELAYCLGQMQREEAIPKLRELLNNFQEHPMVRHEAGEALGAIGTDECARIVKDFCQDSVSVVADTCKIANLKMSNTDRTKCRGKYASIDPAARFEGSGPQDVKTLRSILITDNEEEKMLYSRYAAMFELRDIGSDEAIQALCDGLKCKNPLLKHEVAFVLGQLQNPISIPALEYGLTDVKENEMVRHECAEALGAIGTPECYSILSKFLEDPVDVVRESCIVGLDICEYELSNSLHYADGRAIIAVEEPGLK
jgi:deoxyhypusine monooxygenase